MRRCLSDPHSALAAVIVLDQFSRNMFRGDPRAFASDAKALALAEAAIGKGYLGGAEQGRAAVSLPAVRALRRPRSSRSRCVELMSGLGDPELTRYAQAHCDIIQRFGRFPHRNDILGPHLDRGGDRVPEAAGQLVLNPVTDPRPEPVEGRIESGAGRASTSSAQGRRLSSCLAVSSQRPLPRRQATPSIWPVRAPAANTIRMCRQILPSTFLNDDVGLTTPLMRPLLAPPYEGRAVTDFRQRNADRFQGGNLVALVEVGLQVGELGPHLALGSVLDSGRSTCRAVSRPACCLGRLRTARAPPAAATTHTRRRP